MVVAKSKFGSTNKIVAQLEVERQVELGFLIKVGESAENVYLVKWPLRILIRLLETYLGWGGFLLKLPESTLNQLRIVVKALNAYDY